MLRLKCKNSHSYITLHYSVNDQWKEFSFINDIRKFNNHFKVNLLETLQQRQFKGIIVRLQL